MYSSSVWLCVLVYQCFRFTSGLWLCVLVYQCFIPVVYSHEYWCIISVSYIPVVYGHVYWCISVFDIPVVYGNAYWCISVFYSGVWPWILMHLCVFYIPAGYWSISVFYNYSGGLWPWILCISLFYIPVVYGHSYWCNPVLCVR